MKRIKRLLFILLLMIPVIVNAAGSVTVSSSKLTVDVGSSSSFTIKASSAAGRIDITSSDTSVATVSTNSQFLDNSSVKIKVNGKREGTATITVKFVDVATYDRQPITGTKKITITVKKPTPKVMKVTKIDVVGYDINFDATKMEYTIDVDPDLKKVYVITSCENCTVSGDKTVNIENVDSFKVKFANGSDIKEYVIKINKKKANTVQTIETPKETAKPKEVVKSEPNLYIYTTIILGIGCAILSVLLIMSKKNKKEVPNVVLTHSPGERHFIIPEQNQGSVVNNNIQEIK